MTVVSLNKVDGNQSISKSSLLVITTDSGAPIAVFGQDKSNAIWSLKAGDPGFDDYVKARNLAPQDFQTTKKTL